MKTCKRCTISKAVSNFNSEPRNSDGLHSYCIPCQKEYQKENYLKNRNKKKQYYKDNEIIIKKKRKKFAKDNPEKIKEQNKKAYQKNRKKRISNQKVYAKNNKEKIKKYHSKYSKQYRRQKISTDVFFKAKCSIRDLIKRSFRDKNFSKNSKTGIILGCSYEEFKQYIESKWESWMSWNNYGNWDGIAQTINHSWEFDHIIPLCQAKNEEELLKLNHYTNFQPLCSYTNRFIKRGKI